MLRASSGGRDAARPRSGRRSTVDRHALVRLTIRSLPALACGTGWSALSLALCSILMSWDAAPTLGQRFESARAVLDAALPRRRRTPRTYQGFIKAIMARGLGLVPALAAHLRGLTRRAAGSAWSSGGLVPIGVDGSKFDAPRTIGNEPLGFAGKDRCGPQMLGLLLVHLGAMLPWAFVSGGARDSERALLRSCLRLLPERTLLVADAGFTGFDLLSDLHARGLHFLVRVGRGAHLLTSLGYARREGRDTVYLWPERFTSRPPLVLRLIRVGQVCLVTNVLDPRRLSTRAAAEWYRRRWGLEVAFRSLKQTLERRRVRSGTAPHARLELDFAVLGLWMLALLGVRAIAAAGHAAIRLSLAAALTAVRAAMHRPASDRWLRGRLRRAVRDDHRRRAPKTAWRWPHKKRPPVPGQPRLTAATPPQISLAKALRTRSHAA